MNRNSPQLNCLVANTEITIRFSESDAMGIVWHGNYLKFFEDGREAFGNKYGINFLDVFAKEKFLTPLVKTTCEYKRPLKYGDKAIVETTFVDTDAAKLIFSYKIYRSSDNLLSTTGETIQVFTNEQGELNITVPAFFSEWKKKWLK